ASPFCNASLAPIVQLPGGGHPKFELPDVWAEACAQVTHFPNETVSEGHNWCWSWLKHLGCRRSEASRSWRDSQDFVARMDLAPPPDVVDMQPLKDPSVCEQYWLGGPLSVSPHERDSIQQWFAANVAVYALDVSLDEGAVRETRARLQELGIEHTLVPGLDLEKTGLMGLVPEGFDLEQAQIEASLPDKYMSDVLAAASASAARLRAMRLVKTHNRRPLAIILEGGAMPEDDFAAKVFQLLVHEAPCDWQVISLKSRCPYGVCVAPHLARILPDGNEPDESCNYGTNLGMPAMLWKLEGMHHVTDALEEAVWQHDQPRCLETDVALSSLADRIAYYAVPSMQTPGLLADSLPQWRRRVAAAAALKANLQTTTTATTSTSTTSTTTTTSSSTSTTTTTPTTVDKILRGQWSPTGEGGMDLPADAASLGAPDGEYGEPAPNDSASPAPAPRVGSLGGSPSPGPAPEGRRASSRRARCGCTPRPPGSRAGPGGWSARATSAQATAST
ncbi:unnamed protein product, partial [Prorocentrum cordatum]